MPSTRLGAPAPSATSTNERTSSSRRASEPSSRQMTRSLIADAPTRRTYSGVTSSGSRHDQRAVGGERPPGVVGEPVGTIEQNRGRVLRQDPRRLVLERPQRVVTHLVAIDEGEHPPQRLALVESDHRESAVRCPQLPQRVPRVDTFRRHVLVTPPWCHLSDSSAAPERFRTSSACGIALRPSMARHESAATVAATVAASTRPAPRTVAASRAPWNTSPAPRVETTSVSTAGTWTRSSPSSRYAPSPPAVATTAPAPAARAAPPLSHRAQRRIRSGRHGATVRRHAARHPEGERSTGW